MLALLASAGAGATVPSADARAPTVATGILEAPAAAAVPSAVAAPVDDVLPARLADLDDQVAHVLRTFHVPGMAIAIVKDGEVVLVRGYGVREAGKAAAVDADTLFAIASITKGFTSTALSVLAGEGRLALEDRVLDHLPWFRMADPYITREMRIRDLLVHRSGLGLGAGDLLFWPSTTYSTREVVERLADVPIAHGFRERYAYDNVLYAVAQLVIEQVSGMSYADFVQQRLFAPVGMAATRNNSDALRAGDAVATGHARPGFTGAPQPVARMAWANNSAAGGIYSSARDMARWMQVQLDAGVLPGSTPRRRLFSAERQQAMWSVVTPIPIANPVVPELAALRPAFAGYGEGWTLTDYRGRKLVWHTGGWPGMVSRLTLVPESRLGIVVLTNQEVSAAFNAVTMQVLDAYLEAPRTDWTAAYAAAVARGSTRAAADWAAHVAARDATRRPTRPLSAFAGTYRDAWYGDVELAVDGGASTLRFTRTPQLLGDLEHWQGDTWLVKWRERSLNADAFLTFATTPDGAVREARMETVSPETDFSFDFHDLRLLPLAP